VCLRVMFRVDLPLSALIGDISLIQREPGSPVRRSQKQPAVDSSLVRSLLVELHLSASARRGACAAVHPLLPSGTQYACPSACLSPSTPTVYTRAARDPWLTRTLTCHNARQVVTSASTSVLSPAAWFLTRMKTVPTVITLHFSISQSVDRLYALQLPLICFDMSLSTTPLLPRAPAPSLSYLDISLL
jgi:hypothetical protein